MNYYRYYLYRGLVRYGVVFFLAYLFIILKQWAGLSGEFNPRPDNFHK